MIVVAFAVGLVAGIAVERWHAGALGRSDAVCTASLQELARFEEILARSPRAVSNDDFMKLIALSQERIGRNCGWLPSSVVLPTPRPTEGPKPAAPAASPGAP